MKSFFRSLPVIILLILLALGITFVLTGFLVRYPLLSSFMIGLAGSVSFLGFLLFRRHLRQRRADLLQRITLYQNHTPGEFERATAEVYRSSGYEVELTGKSGDLGLDILLQKNGEQIGVQCKRYKDPIGPALVREFVGALEGMRLEKGYLVTTSTFTAGAVKAAQRSRFDVNLVTGSELIQLRNQVENPYVRALIPGDRWRELPPAAKAFWMLLLLIDIGLFFGLSAYWILAG
jgi:HJR/Mrr/RecB family endonuclease